jgi:hypothetical protein
MSSQTTLEMAMDEFIRAYNAAGKIVAQIVEQAEQILKSLGNKK